MPQDPNLRLARSADYPSEHMLALENRVSTGPKLFVDEINLVDRSFGKTVPQGGLFAYLFRRFGYPNQGSDPHKDLCTYTLTTAHPKMLLMITPYAGGDADLGIRFMVPAEVSSAVRAWETRFMDAHEAAFLDWIEQTDQVPAWADEVIQEVAEMGMPLETPSYGWRRIRRALDWISWKAKRENRTDARVAWLEDARSRFAAAYPDLPSGIAYRDPDPETWGKDDPLCEYAKAIEVTLADLKRPVWVRDIPIDPWGKVAEQNLPLVPDEEDDEEDDEDMMTYEDSGPDLVAPVAGYPSGDLGNQDPEGFAELHGAIIQAGNGNAAAGIARTLALLAAAQAGPNTENDK